MPEVLVIDDSGMCRELLCRSLEVHGYAAVCASPQEAMSVYQQAEPGLVIIDPGRADSQGWKFLTALKRAGANPNLQIVIITDHAGKQDVMQAVTLGIRDYMLKHRFSLAELLTRVRRHVAPSRSPHREGEPMAPSSSRQTTPPSKPAAAESVSREPKSAPAIAIRHPDSGASKDKLGDLADEIGIKRMTKIKTLERLESAPVKTLPGVVAELISLVNSPRGTVSDVALILRRDPLMTARILRVANSAAFASQRTRIASVEDAVKNIGVAGVRNLVVNVGVFDAFSTDGAGDARVQPRVWQHCLGVAMLMEKLGPHDDPSVPPGSAYLVGLCHDLADIVLRHHFKTQYDSISKLMIEADCPLRAAENAVFGLPYRELVSQLLSRLRLPPLITLPIEEFYERDEKKAAGAGSLLSRRLRAANVYMHGLLLSPDAQQPVTPFTKAEYVGTFGNSSETCDDDLLRGEALATASMLAGLTPSQTQQMCQPLVQQTPIRVCYRRHDDYVKFDPLMAILRLTAREVKLLPPLNTTEPQFLQDNDALIVAGPRSAGDAALQEEIGSMRRILNGRPIAALHLGDTLSNTPKSGDNAISLKPLPLNIETLGAFLAAPVDSSRAGVAARAA